MRSVRRVWKTLETAAYWLYLATALRYVYTRGRAHSKSRARRRRRGRARDDRHTGDARAEVVRSSARKHCLITPLPSSDVGGFLFVRRPRAARRHAVVSARRRRRLIVCALYGLVPSVLGRRCSTGFWCDARTRRNPIRRYEIVLEFMFLDSDRSEGSRGFTTMFLFFPQALFGTLDFWTKKYHPATLYIGRRIVNDTLRVR